MSLMGCAVLECVRLVSPVMMLLEQFSVSISRTALVAVISAAKL
jgi:hypothetical protein